MAPAELPHPREQFALSRAPNISYAKREMLRFLRLARNAGLLPVIEEYHGDKFVAHNLLGALGRLSCRRQVPGRCLPVGCGSMRRLGPSKVACSAMFARSMAAPLGEYHPPFLRWRSTTSASYGSTTAPR